MNEKKIGYAGIKDKQAVTEQYISVFGYKNLKVDIDQVSFEYVSSGSKPISIGDLERNYFEIVVRNVEDKPEVIEYCENYFDEQRFSKNNVAIGRALVKKDFSQACKLIDKDVVKNHLLVKNNDYIGALQKLSIRFLRFFVNAYQSYLWNETVSKYLENNYSGKKVEYSQGELFFVDDMDESILDMSFPLVGFGTNVGEEYKDIIDSILEEEKLSTSDFIIKQIPDISAEGEVRKIFVNVNDFEIGEFLDDELNDGIKKVVVKFSLSKGSYATMIIRKLFKS